MRWLLSARRRSEGLRRPHQSHPMFPANQRDACGKPSILTKGKTARSAPQRLPMTILPATPDQLDNVEAITRETIAAIYPRYYPAGAVAFFRAHHSRENIARDIEAGRVFLAMDGDRPVGTITLQDNHIGRLFVLPAHQGQGAGRLLMQFAEETIFARHETILLDASLPAKQMYLKNGYHEVAYHIIETDDGDYLCYDEMRKKRPVL